METIEFKCEHCGVSVTALAQYAGQTGTCPGCGLEMAIPPLQRELMQKHSRPKNPIPQEKLACPIPRQQNMPLPAALGVPPEKSVATAIGMNLLLFGLGYFYLGLVGSGVICLLLDLILVPVCIGGFPGAFGLAAVLQIVGICDVVARCEKLKKERTAQMERLQQWQEMQNLKRCPYCGEAIQKSAILCRFCGSRLDEEDGTV